MAINGLAVNLFLTHCKIPADIPATIPAGVSPRRPGRPSRTGQFGLV